MQIAIFLRGINTGKLKLLKEDFITILETSGFGDVSTIQAAGTAVCTVREDCVEHAISSLSKALFNLYKKEIAIFTLDKQQLEMIIDHANQLNIKERLHCYVMLYNSPSLFDDAVKAHSDIRYLKDEQLIAGDKYFFWIVPKGETLGEYGKKVLGKPPFKDNLTSRNINTIRKVFKKIG